MLLFVDSMNSTKADNRFRSVLGRDTAHAFIIPRGLRKLPITNAVGELGVSLYHVLLVALHLVGSSAAETMR